uniref:Uncharacterized protein n=1 Tax=Romanomermis culicivorax TaxID=13658 RepID=A0A915L6U1_ROMCU
MKQNKSRLDASGCNFDDRPLIQRDQTDSHLWKMCNKENKFNIQVCQLFYGCVPYSELRSANKAVQSTMCRDLAYSLPAESFKQTFLNPRQECNLASITQEFLLYENCGITLGREGQASGKSG